MEPKGWFTRGNDVIEGKIDNLEFWHPIIKMRKYAWSLTPAAVDTCIEELRKARMKRKAYFYIVVLAKLFTILWLKQLNKVADFYF